MIDQTYEFLAGLSKPALALLLISAIVVIRQLQRVVERRLRDRRRAAKAGAAQA